MIFHIFICIPHHLRVYYELTLHRYRRGHGFKSRSGRNLFFFRLQFHKLTEKSTTTRSIFMGSGFKNIRIRSPIRRMRVDGSRIWKEKVADSKISGYVWRRPKIVHVFAIMSYLLGNFSDSQGKCFSRQVSSIVIADLPSGINVEGGKRKRMRGGKKKENERFSFLIRFLIAAFFCNFTVELPQDPARSKRFSEVMPS